MTIDREPGNGLFAKAVQAYMRREALERDQASKEFEGIRQSVLKDGNFSGQLSGVPDIEVPRIDDSIQQGLKRIRIIHRMDLPSSKN